MRFLNSHIIYHKINLTNLIPETAKKKKSFKIHKW